MQKFAITLSLFLLFSAFVNAQKKTGYIKSNDSFITYGITLKFDPYYPRVVYSLSSEAPPISYNAVDIIEFGFEDSTKFVSRKLMIDNQMQTVFLKFLVEGEVGLLLFENGSNRQYFIEENSKLTLLERDSYINILSNYLDCDKQKNQLKNLDYSSRSFIDFVSGYKSGACRNIRYTSFGLSLGYGTTSLLLSPESFSSDLLDPLGRAYGDFDIRSSSWSLGGYIETPLWRVKKLSLLGRLTYTHNTLITSREGANRNGDFKYEYSRVILNVIPKYTFNTDKVRYFIGVGSAVSTTLKFESEVFSAIFDTGTIRFESENDITKSSPFQFGITGVVGVEFFYTDRRYLSLEFTSSNRVGGVFSTAENSLMLRVNL